MRLYLYPLLLLCYRSFQKSNPFTADVKPVKCRDSSPRIYKGQLAGEHEFPWAVRLILEFPLNGKIGLCSSSLVTPNYLITAGHCVYDSNLPGTHPVELMHGLIGNADVSNSKKIEFKKVWLHPEYNPSTIAHDIAIIKTKKPLDLNELGVGTICIAESSFKLKDKEEVTSVGWGLHAPGDVDNLLRKTNSVLITNNLNCMSEIGFTFPEMMRCIESKTGHELCGGDSGGPLMVKTENGYVLVGVASLSAEANCLRPAAISVCTMVTYFTPWIKETMNDDSLCFIS